MMSTKIKYKDFPIIDRLRTDDLKNTNEIHTVNRVVFMGNSITQGWIDYGNPELFTKNPYINKGINGQTTSQMLERFISDVIALKPKVVVILAGINDIAENTGSTTLEMIQDNIIAMVELAKANQIKVILSSILPANRLRWRPHIYPADKIIAMNIFLKHFAAQNACSYIDYYTPLVDHKKGMKSDYSEDGVHPNKAGYDIMTNLVQVAIDKMLKNN